MKQLDKGFLLNRISYSESSLILKFFTEKHGLKSMMFQGAKKKKGLALLPLTEWEFTIYQRNDSSLAKMGDLNMFSTFDKIPFHPVKSTIVFFQVDVIQQIIHENLPDITLYRFINHEINWLNEATNFANYPIFWLLQVSTISGFSPFKNDGDTPYFDLQNGEFTSYQPLNASFKFGQDVEILSALSQLEKEELLAYKISKQARKNILNILLEYYKHHIPNFRFETSMDVIETIWE